MNEQTNISASNDYVPFPVANFRTGFDQAVEPWLLPRDAFQRLENASLYRGVVEKEPGYSRYANMAYRAIITLAPAPDGVIKTFTATLPAGARPPSTQNFFGSSKVGPATAETWTYASDGTPPTINLISSALGTGTLNTTTGALSLTFTTAPTNDAYNTVIFEFDAVPPVPTDIMGIKPYFASNGDQDILIFDTKRVGKVVGITSAIIAAGQAAVQGVSELPHQYLTANAIVGDAMATVFTGTSGGNPIHPGTVEFLKYTSAGVAQSGTITDDGANGLVGTGVTGGGASFINYSTGAWQVTFAVAPANTVRYHLSTCVYGDVFHGTFSDFFSVDNFKDKAFIVNNVDRPVYYDGTCVHYVPTNLTVKPITTSSGVPQYDITKALHNLAYRERLVYLSPTTPDGQETSSAIWSTIQEPLNWTNDEGEDAPTSQPIQAWGLINNDLIVRFANSERILRYTGDAFAPFRWDSTNNLFHCDAAFSGINYDSYFSSVGRPAIVASDGVNVRRADEIIPDFTFNDRISVEAPVISIDQTSIGQCYGERFDMFKEGWLCYKAQQKTDNGTVMRSDSVLAFNYQDGTYAIYKFPFNVLGYGKRINQVLWGTDFQLWEADGTEWGSFDGAKNAIVSLAGDRDGVVWELGTGYTLGSPNLVNLNPVLFDVITKNFNPFIESGEQCRLGWIDFFFDAFTNSKVRVQIFANDQMFEEPDGSLSGSYYEVTLSLDGGGQSKIWKRVYVGAIAKEHTIRVHQVVEDFTSTTLAQDVKMNAMIPWFKSAGRVFT